MKFTTEECEARAIKSVLDAQFHRREHAIETYRYALMACRTWTRRAEWAALNGGDISSGDFGDVERHLETFDGVLQPSREWKENT